MRLLKRSIQRPSSKVISYLSCMTLTKAHAGVKNNMRRINKKIIQSGSNHLVHIVLFALGCFFLVYVVKILPEMKYHDLVVSRKKENESSISTFCSCVCCSNGICRLILQYYGRRCWFFLAKNGRTC